MARRKRVALLIEAGRAYGRGLLYGIARYLRTQGQWSVYHHERRLGDEAPPWLKGWDGDGVIARIENKKLLTALVKLGLPTVDVNALHEIPGVPAIDTDNRRVVELAVAHLVEHGFANMAYCGYGGLYYSVQRRDHFAALMAGQGRAAMVYESPVERTDALTSAVEERGMLYEDDVVQWVRSLPRPVGVVACNDIRGRQLLNACRAHGIAVPDEVAVIGVDNDELLCELADPPLSSVEPHCERIGYEAAELLDSMMRERGRSAGAGDPDLRPRRAQVWLESTSGGSGGRRLIEPRGVVGRQSTDTLALADREIVRAVRFMREHACDGITVDAVLGHVAMSRSTLERRFMTLLGRSPKEEIIRVRTERVKRLLAETDYALPKIAQLTGFKHHGHLSAQFKRKTGLTPGEYRRRMGAGGV